LLSWLRPGSCYRGDGIDLWKSGAPGVGIVMKDGIADADVERSSSNIQCSQRRSRPPRVREPDYSGVTANKYMHPLRAFPFGHPTIKLLQFFFLSLSLRTGLLPWQVPPAETFGAEKATFEWNRNRELARSARSGQTPTKRRKRRVGPARISWSRQTNNE